MVNGSTIPRAYGLPKIHKTVCPLRIIVSSVNSSLYNLAYYLYFITSKRAFLQLPAIYLTAMI